MSRPHRHRPAPFDVVLPSRHRLAILLPLAFALPRLCLALDDSDGIGQDEGQTMAKAGEQEDGEGEGAGRWREGSTTARGQDDWACAQDDTGETMLTRIKTRFELKSSTSLSN
jgi:hypothetical protein